MLRDGLSSSASQDFLMERNVYEQCLAWAGQNLVLFGLLNVRMYRGLG
jgi:hypothetical protein